jgi:RHS repeat-associated protein
VTITKPTGTAANDVLIASIAVTPSTVTITAPSGWTLIRRTNNGATTSNSLAVYYKVASASEGTSYAFGVTGATFGVGGIQGFTGVDTANPIHIENGQTTPSATTHATPSVTTSVANAMIVTSHAFASSNSWTPPSGMTESFDKPSGNNNATGLSIEGDRVLQAVAGATGVKTATAAGNADVGNTHIVALKPADATLTISTPTGTVADDVLIAAIGFNNSTATVAPPSGWTLVRRMNNASTTANSLAVYRRTAVAGEPASHAFLVAGGAFVVGGIQAFSGVDTANPIDVENGQTTVSGTAHATPSVTTTTANAMLVTAHTYASANTWTPQAGLTEAYDRPSGTNSATGQAITGTFQLQAVAGASGAKSSTAGGSADVGNTHILALRRLLPNTPPTVSITSPANNAVFPAPASFTLTATASDPDGTITKVDFFQGATLVGTATTSPYSVPVSNLAAGSYSYTAVATDNRSGTTTSTPVNVIVDSLPGVALTSPANNATFTAPANITLSATASDTDGTIQKVEFFYGGTNLIATVTTPPYSVIWTSVPQGTYSITAVATDDRGVPTTSTAVNVTVNQAQALYFIQVDHLNTPRLVADSAAATVWKWDQQEPFGDSVADEDPNGFGAFELPLRFAGQYFDKETNLHYNYYRDYDPSVARYAESDPIGLRGGINTYAYVAANPLLGTDPLGLAKFCCRYLDSFVFGTILGRRHCYVIADDGTTYGLYPENVGGREIGVPRTNDPRDRGGDCFNCPKLECGSDQNACLRNAHGGYPRGKYSAYPGPNSNTYAATLARQCCQGGVPSGASGAPGFDSSPPSR